MSRHRRPYGKEDAYSSPSICSFLCEYHIYVYYYHATLYQSRFCIHLQMSQFLIDVFIINGHKWLITSQAGAKMGSF